MILLYVAGHRMNPVMGSQLEEAVSLGAWLGIFHQARVSVKIAWEENHCCINFYLPASTQNTKIKKEKRRGRGQNKNKLETQPLRLVLFHAVESKWHRKVPAQAAWFLKQPLIPCAEAGFSLLTNHQRHHPFLVVGFVWPPRKLVSCNAQHNHPEYTHQINIYQNLR